MIALKENPMKKGCKTLYPPKIELWPISLNSFRDLGSQVPCSGKAKTIVPETIVDPMHSGLLSGLLFPLK